MLLSNLNLNRQGYKTPQQTAGTEDSVFVSNNPTRQSNPQTNINKYIQQQSEYGTPNVFTGTVITSCFIQTTALPSRIEIAGNDVTFYDDTFVEGGVIKGDTSRMVFTHDLNSNEGFIMEKRSSVNDTYDNVLSWYATPARAGSHNYMFIGRDGRAAASQRNLHSIHYNIDRDSSLAVDPDNFLNGVYEIEYSVDGVKQYSNQKLYMGGNSPQIFIGSGLTGFSSVVFGGYGGWGGIGYAINSGARDSYSIGIYMDSATRGRLGVDLIPDTAGLNLGSPTDKFGTFYGSVSACPLPTVENALELLETIEAPTYVGERGHYGLDKKYFDDLTFPSELLHTDSNGHTDIEHNLLLGFLLKSIVELNQKVKDLQSQLS